MTLLARNTDPYLVWRWRAVWPFVVTAGAILVALLVFALALPAYALLASGGVRRTLVLQLLDYLPSLPSLLAYRLAQYSQWQATAPGSFALAGCIALAAGAAAGLRIALANPFPRVPPIFGDARFARSADLARMERRGIASVRRGSLLHLGLVQNRPLRAMETLSALVVAPPGSGKTAGFVVPTLLDSGAVSFVVHDLKPEIADLTSAYRARLGPVWILDWAATDAPEDGLLYPRWNPLSARSMPPRGAQRDLYIDRLAKILVPEEGHQDPFWPRKAQALLTGCIQFLAARINDRCDKARWNGLPRAWHGEEASLPMLLDWLTEGQLAARERGGGNDPMAAFFAGAIQEAKRNDYPYRAVQELTDAMSTADRTRDGVLTTLTGALSIFRNEAVRARTSASDFAFADLRGVRATAAPGARGRWRPVTIYLRTRQEDAKALAVINALFIDALTAFLVGSDRGTGKIGPLDVCFALDELPQLPKLDAALTGPAVGRSKGVFFLLIAQDLKQLESKYGAAETSALQTSCAFTVVFNQNNYDTAKALSDRVGQYTYVKLSTSDRERGGDSAAQLTQSGVSRSRSFEGAPLLKPQDLMSIPHGRHYVLVQGFNDRPVRARTPWWFRDARLRARARGTPASPMPPALMRAAIAARAQRLAAAAAAQDERLYVVTPDDVESFGAAPGWGGVAARLHGNSWTVRAMAGGSLAQIDQLRSNARLVLYDRAALQNLSAALRVPIDEASCDFVRDRVRAPSLAAAAAALVPEGTAAIEPDTAALLLMELFGADEP